MSVTMSVFLESSKTALPARWAEAIRSSGFLLEMDTGFDVRTFSGFLPCKYDGKDAGFEYFWDTANECSLVDGVLWDTESNELIPASDALKWAKDMEADIRKEL